MSLILFSVAVLFTSLGAGMVGAILGLGGGILLVPILTVFYGVDIHYAMGASIISVIATSSGAAASYLRTGLSNLRIGLFLVVATISVALSYSAYTTIRQLADELPEDVSSDRLAIRFGLEGAYHDLRLQRHVSYRARNVVGGFTAMFGAGVLSGMLGIGSGAFKVLAMDYLMRLPMKVSTATSNFMIGLTAAASAGIYFSRGDIHVLIVAPVAIGVMAGAYMGTHLIAYMRNTTVRKLFLPIVVYLALSMILRGLGIHLL
jgi:hypothetical protein